ncbi:WD40 repeat domain-containing protein [Streptomyces sp. NPDC058656]|uniref:WD40 repeat domain-containing protein n=1 Tax=unclassified Streptomyces TaxID=2593676 RepID=UPI00365BFA80
MGSRASRTAPSPACSSKTPPTGHADGITHAAFHPNEHLLATSGDGCTTRFWAWPGLPTGGGYGRSTILPWVCPRSSSRNASRTCSSG